MENENADDLSSIERDNQLAVSNRIDIDQEELESIEREKVEKERQAILNSAIAGKIDNIRERVAYILNNYIPAMNSDIKLAC